ncbi:MAG: hypothetical protein H5U26_11550 [Immundisolibacter sp.]|uniref:hypothetical protein n=1 Tax=Immundisolibacter sp. TaxID=1934948 RepID=UPI0019839A98|nr:hypothetical protein [Immundisolibacter sp.]MBC7162724.1 hypothetical protein [Immundisolibacter sp.]
MDPELLAERRAFVVSAVEGGDMPTAKQLAGWLETATHIGRIQAALVNATVAERIVAESYRAVAKSKSYEGLPYHTPDGEARHVASLDEFCQAFFGRSKRRCQELATNLEALGAELYEAGEHIGLGQRDYNALRALPADDQAVVKAALAEGSDKSAVLDLLNELASRLQEAKAEKETLDRRAKAQAARNQELQDSLADSKHFLRSAPPAERAREMLMELAAQFMDSRVSIGRTEEALLKFFEYTNEHELDFDADIGGRVTELLMPVLAIAGELKITRGIDLPLRQAAQLLSAHKDLSTGA